MKPQGRLTLQSGKPIPTSDVSSPTLYYTSFEGDCVPLWSGSAWVDTPTAELNISLAVADGLYDVFVTAAGLELSPWATLIAKSIPVGVVHGQWCDAAKRTYLGCVYVKSGCATMQFKPTPIPYGTNNMLGLWNAYNRKPVRAVCKDLTESWVYGSYSARFANNSDRFRISWVDGLGHSLCKASYTTSVASMAAGLQAATVAPILDAAYPLSVGGELSQGALSAANTGTGVEGRNFIHGALGLHYWQAAEETTPVPITCYGNDFSALVVELEM